MSARAQELQSTGTSAGGLLLIESDPDAARRLLHQLTLDGHEVTIARCAEHARVLAVNEPSLAILGRLGGGRGALDLLCEVRAGESALERNMPIIVIGPGHGELDLLRAFEAGADDFVAFPPPHLELRARIGALLRRTSHRQPRTRVRVGALSIDTDARAVQVHGRDICLRRMEYELLAHLAGSPQRVFSSEELLRNVWGYRAQCETRTIDTHASRLRRKLVDAGNGPCVVNVRGIGYRLI